MGNVFTSKRSLSGSPDHPDASTAPPPTMKREPPELNIEWKEIDATICQEQELPQTDLVLLTANDNELQACYQFMENIKRYNHQKLGYVHIGTLKGSSNRVALKRCRQGPASAQTASADCIQYLNPKAIIFVGICATLKREKFKLGDVILPRRLEPYDPQKVTEDGRIENRGVQGHPPDPMSNLFLESGVGWKKPLKLPQKPDFKIHSENATMLSGSKLVNNKTERDLLLRRFPDALALEMEGAGLLEAVEKIHIQWAVVKAASDFADGSKDLTDSWQRFSSAMAASVVHNIFKNDVMRKWPRAHDARKRSTSDPTSSSNTVFDTPEGMVTQSVEISGSNSTVIIGHNTKTTVKHGES